MTDTHTQVFSQLHQGAVVAVFSFEGTEHVAVTARMLSGPCRVKRAELLQP